MILTIILIFILLFIIYNIRIHLLWGRIYDVNQGFTFSEIGDCLKLLRDANDGAILRIIFPKAQIRFAIIKKQNEKEWWFELQVNKRKGEIFKNAYFERYNNKIIYRKNKMVLYLGYDIQAICSFLEDVFIKELQIDKNSKISASFKNTRVLNNIEYYKKKFNVTDNN